MKKLSIVFLIIFMMLASAFMFADQTDPKAKKKHETEELYKLFSKQVKLGDNDQKASYAIGYNMGQSVRKVFADLELSLILQGLVDGLRGDDKAQMRKDEMRDTLKEFQRSLWDRKEKERKEKGEQNKIEGPKFLAENAKKEGVITTASGLQYKVLKEGTGPLPKETDWVKVHYRGTLINGDEFDSSFSRGKPSVFPVNRVIDGWTEALQLMKVGSKWKLYIPSEIAYGERGKGVAIAPNATLIYELELLSIEPPKEMPAPKNKKVKVTAKPKKEEK